VKKESGMKLSLKTITLALALGAGAMVALPGVQLIQPAAAESVAERETLARQLILDAGAVSHTPEIYEETRVFLRTVLVPVAKDVVSGKIPSSLPNTPEFKALSSKLVNGAELLVKASDDVDQFIKANKDEMISDAARVLAKHFSQEELEQVRASLKLEAVRKGFDGFYMFTKFAVTGYTYEETRRAQEFMGWAENVVMGRTGAGKTPQVINPNPTAEQKQKAEAIVKDFMRVSQVESIIDDGIQFARSVVIKSLPPEGQAQASAGLDQVEFMYAAQKPAVLAAAPMVIAQFLKDEELEKVHNFVKTPVFAKVFKLLRDSQKTFTAINLEDVTQAKVFFEDMKKKGVLRERNSEEKKAFEADLEAYSQKWAAKATDAIEPQTRQGLMQLVAELQALNSND
jgi:hypothetical protein